MALQKVQKIHDIDIAIFLFLKNKKMAVTEEFGNDSQKVKVTATSVGEESGLTKKYVRKLQKKHKRY